MKRSLLILIAAFLTLSFQHKLKQASLLWEKNNTTLWYTAPAGRWTEALPIGNGRFGAMIFGDPINERLQLNDITVWSGDPQPDADRPDAWKHLDTIRKAIRSGENKTAGELANKHFTSPAPYENSYQTLGDIRMRFNLSDTPQSEYYRWLNIDEAVAGVSFTSNENNYTRELFSSAPDQVIAQQLISSKKGELSFEVSLNRIERAKTRFEAPNTLIMTGSTGNTLTYEVQLRILNKGGNITGTAESLKIENADEVTMLVTCATSYTLNYTHGFKGEEPHRLASLHMKNATAKTYAQLRENHIRDYQKYFRRVNIDIGSAAVTQPTDERLKNYGNGSKDPRFVGLFYQYGRYLLISSSRPDNPLPSNSQGIWGDGLNLPWKCDYKSNINYQMNYWQAEQANLAELHLPMIRMIQALQLPVTKTAKTYYGLNTPGWFYGYTTNAWGWTSPGAYLPWGIFNGGSGWACQHLWEHYAFGRDKNYLRSVYPTLKGAAEFYMATMINDQNGWLITSPSTSPENTFITDSGVKGSVDEGATMERSIIWDLLDNVAEACQELQTDPEFRKKVVRARDQIRPLQIGKAGQLMEWQQDWDMNSDDPQHRHVSHLFALHPGHQITALGTPRLAAAARKTLEIRGDDGTGWSIAWKENFWARLREGDHAHRLLSNQLRYTNETKTIMAAAGGTYPNLFDAHPPFQIDGNFGAVAGVTEMLLQSSENTIDLLPALPNAWPKGSISWLRARGGFEVSITWQNRHLSSAIIKSNSGERCRIRYSRPFNVNGKEAILNKANKHYELSFRTVKNGRYQVITG